MSRAGDITPSFLPRVVGPPPIYIVGIFGIEIFFQNFGLVKIELLF